jgi:hypothetical protein
MNFTIVMGVPEMSYLWNELQHKYRSGKISRQESRLYKKWGKALQLLS